MNPGQLMTRTTRVLCYSVTALHCDVCGLDWIPGGDWDDPCPRCKHDPAPPPSQGAGDVASTRDPEGGR